MYDRKLDTTIIKGERRSMMKLIGEKYIPVWIMSVMFMLGLGYGGYWILWYQLEMRKTRKYQRGGLKKGLLSEIENEYVSRRRKGEKIKITFYVKDRLNDRYRYKNLTIICGNFCVIFGILSSLLLNLNQSVSWDYVRHAVLLYILTGILYLYLLKIVDGINRTNQRCHNLSDKMINYLQNDFHMAVPVVAEVTEGKETAETGTAEIETAETEIPEKLERTAGWQKKSNNSPEQINHNSKVPKKNHSQTQETHRENPAGELTIEEKEAKRKREALKQKVKVNEKCIEEVFDEFFV